MVEYETNIKIKCLRSDNDGEYIVGDFKQYCIENRMKMIKTISRTPQQNGIAKRMNTTLKKCARSMRIYCGLPKTFWADLINTPVYLNIRGPSIPLGF